jgi:hypothetical protein
MIFNHPHCAYNLPKVTSVVPTTSQKSLPLCLQPPKSHFRCAYNLLKVTSVVPTTSQKSLPSLISGGIFISSQLKEKIFKFPTKFFHSVSISMKIALTFDFPIQRSYGEHNRRLQPNGNEFRKCYRNGFN